MATLDQIASALKKAHAAGNAEDAAKLAKAYRAMQDQPGGTTPGEAATAAPERQQDWANNPVADQLATGFASAINAIPIAGPSILDGLTSLKSAVHTNLLGNPTTPEQLDAETAAQQEANPIASGVGTVTGTVAPFVAGGAVPWIAKMLGMSGNLGTRAAMGGLSGYGIGGADALVRSGGDWDAAAESANLGGGLGAALPFAGKAAQLLFKGAPRAAQGSTAQEIKQVGSDFYKAATSSPALLVPNATEVLTRDFATLLASEGVTAGGKIVGGFGKVRKAVKHLDRLRGKPVTMQQLQRFEETLQDIAASPKAGEARLGTMLLDQLDDYLDALPPTAFTGGNGVMATEALKAGKQTWALFKKTKTIEKAMNRARINGGGESELRAQFAALLKDERKLRGFSPEQIAAIDAFVTKGSPVGNMFRALAKDGGLPKLATAAVGAQTVMDRSARRGAADIRDMVANGWQMPQPETGGEWLKRMFMEDTGGTSLIGPAGLAQLANQRP